MDITIILDNYGSETSWEILDDQGTEVISGGPYTDFNIGQINISTSCLVDGCYDFIIHDSYGDGICCNYGFGEYEVSGPDGTIHASGSSFLANESTNFCLSSQGQAPSAEFTANATTICKGLSIDFMDNSNLGPTEWLWTFEGANPSTSTLQNPQNISYDTEGNYAVTLEVTNANGSDTELKNGYITVTETPSISAFVEDALCWNSEDGSINLQVVGGTAGFTYDWSNGYNGQDLENLSPGSYSILLVDGADCEVSNTFVVGSPDAIQITTENIENALCFNESNGSIEISLSGGTPGYSILWNDPNNQTTNTPLDLIAGNYQVKITDGNGCSMTQGFVVDQPNEILTTTINSIPDSCNLGIGSVELVINGGAPDYTIQWNDPNNQTGPILSNVLTGEYHGTISDNNNCQKTADVYIGEIYCDGTVGVNDLKFEQLILFPNPVNQDNLILDFGNTLGDQLEIVVLDISGKKVMNNHSIPFENHVSLNFENLSNGIYMIELNIDGAIIAKRIIIDRL